MKIKTIFYTFLHFYFTFVAVLFEARRWSGGGRMIWHYFNIFYFGGAYFRYLKFFYLTFWFL